MSSRLFRQQRDRNESERLQARLPRWQQQLFLDFWVPLAYSSSVPAQLITVAETPLFQRQATDVWDENEREDFVNFIARNPEAGDVIADTGGVRKVRWGRGGSGKRGGARVIYFYRDADSRFTCGSSMRRRGKKT
jgi:hypothetical protein